MALEADLAAARGLKVEIVDKGEARIAFAKLEQLDEVVRRLKGARI